MIFSSRTLAEGMNRNFSITKPLFSSAWERNQTFSVLRKWGFAGSFTEEASVSNRRFGMNIGYDHGNDSTRSA